MEITNKKSVFDKLSKYDFTNNDDNTIEVSDWINGEGIDICIIENNTTKSYSLSYNELDAINYLTQVLRYEK